MLSWTPELDSRVGLAHSLVTNGYVSQDSSDVIIDLGITSQTGLLDICVITNLHVSTADVILPGNILQVRDVGNSRARNSVAVIG